ncbi:MULTISPECIES: RNA polymerase sigma factor SigF [Streptomyces]|uniref:RNA polymerase sigma factor SigF n=1 Tax=Streptomyces dengpaensis TaxID=2049881 RepID=A0ABN5HZK5_9ACTN|nr:MULTISPECIES: RNA polymerase sigma factor SigF [Streptomyces]AVH56586.1 RNA polymerase sigma factor SigF [Streptomyces dengpaensis]PIB10389.1 RNA polymerase subunit sigma-70 [Streptomyces sp. HG99]
MRNGDGPVRDEERGTRKLPAERVDGLGGPRRTADGVDGIPEQARPHPVDGASSAVSEAPVDKERERLSGQEDGQWDPEGAARSTSSEGRRLVTGGTMSEHEQHDKPETQSVQAAQHGPSAQHIQHHPQDRSGARAMFVELRKLQEGSAEYAELRNQLVRMHLPLVEHLARRFRNRGEPLDDLTQVATIGLIKSVDRFDPERGVEFSTYATPTVVGEIKRHFRDKGWAVRVPRRLQELRLSLTTATAELSQLHGRSPTVHELAEKLAISEEEVLEGLESANAYSTLSLDVPDTDDESPAVADTLGAEDEALEGVEYRESLKPLLEDLPPREKRILLLRFFGNMTQSQIAQEVGISQMHVSRLLARTLAQLREKLLVEE